MSTWRVTLTYAFPPVFEVLVRAASDRDARRLAIDLAEIAGFTGRIRKIECSVAEQEAA